MTHIEITLSDGRKLLVEIEEFHPVDHAAYQWESGWTCYSETGIEYFISTSGVVWLQPANIEVGIAPVIKAQADAMEKTLAEAYGE